MLESWLKDEKLLKRIDTLDESDAKTLLVLFVSFWHMGRARGREEGKSDA